MPINGYNIGKDASLDVNLPSGPVSFKARTKYTIKQIAKDIESHNSSGDFYGVIPQGWEGTIEIDRTDSNMDIAFDQLIALYKSGANVPGSQITETITNPDGTINQWRYIGLALKFDDHGDFSTDAKVTQKLSWKAGDRIRVV